MDWAWGKEAQFRSDVVPQVSLDAENQGKDHLTCLQKTSANGKPKYLSENMTFYIEEKNGIWFLYRPFVTLCIMNH
jgi:hypothetical protein